MICGIFRNYFPRNTDIFTCQPPELAGKLENLQIYPAGWRNVRIRIGEYWLDGRDRLRTAVEQWAPKI